MNFCDVFTFRGRLEVTDDGMLLYRGIDMLRDFGPSVEEGESFDYAVVCPATGTIRFGHAADEVICYMDLRYDFDRE